MKLVVRDTGIGIEPHIIHRIFDPFFTTKKVGEGTGLGLSVVHGIVKQSNGHIIAESKPGQGSTFTVCFPKIAGRESESEGPEDGSVPIGHERVLFVDDEAALAQMGEGILAEPRLRRDFADEQRGGPLALPEGPLRFRPHHHRPDHARNDRR